jgi:hypothetical protein
MSQTSNTAIAVIGIDIGKNSFHAWLALSRASPIAAPHSIAVTRPSCRATRRSLVHIDACDPRLPQADRGDRFNPTSASPNLRQNPHSARGAAPHTSRDFVPWRFSDARPAQSAERLVVAGVQKPEQLRTSSPDKGTGTQSRKVSTNDLSSRCFSLAYECSGKDRMGACGSRAARTATAIGLYYRRSRRPRDSEIPGVSWLHRSVCSSSHAKSVSLKLQGGGHECGVEGGRDSYRDHRGDGQRSSAL